MKLEESYCGFSRLISNLRQPFYSCRRIYRRIGAVAAKTAMLAGQSTPFDRIKRSHLSQPQPEGYSTSLP